MAKTTEWRKKMQIEQQQELIKSIIIKKHKEDIKKAVLVWNKKG